MTILPVGVRLAASDDRLTIPPALIEAIAERAAELVADPVFASSTGTPVNYHNLWNRVWKPARDAAGITGTGAFHRLRHTFASGD